MDTNYLINGNDLSTLWLMVKDVIDYYDSIDSAYKSPYLYLWGDNTYGQLGMGNNTNLTSPTELPKQYNWNFFSAGSTHVVASSSEGSLWTWGENSSGQLGTGNTTNINAPSRENSTSNWKYVEAGNGTTFASTTSGILWAWGKNDVSQLGLGDTTQKNTKQQVLQVQFPQQSNTFWSKPNANSAMRFDKKIQVWGKNDFGQLGLGDTVDRTTPTNLVLGEVLSFDSSSTHMVVIKTDGTLWSCGKNDFGQLGLGDTTNRSTPTQIGTDNNWKTVIAPIDSDHVLAIKTDGTLWAWGKNDFGQLGLGDTTNRSIPTQVGVETYWNQISGSATHTLAIKDYGALWSWGKNDVGQLGLGDTTNRSTPTRVGSFFNWVRISCGSNFSVALRDNGWLFYNLWLASSLPGSFGDGQAGAEIKAGAGVSLRSDGKLYPSDLAASECVKGISLIDTSINETVSFQRRGIIPLTDIKSYSSLGEVTQDTILYLCNSSPNLGKVCSLITPTEQDVKIGTVINNDFFFIDVVDPRCPTPICAYNIGAWVEMYTLPNYATTYPIGVCIVNTSSTTHTIYYTNNEGLYRKDYGGVWTLVFVPPSYYWYDCYAPTEVNGLIYFLSAEFGIYVYNPSNGSTSFIGEPIGVSGGWQGMAYLHGNLYVICDGNEFIYSYNIASQTWSQSPNLWDSNIVPRYGMCALNNKIYFGSPNGEIYSLTNEDVTNINNYTTEFVPPSFEGYTIAFKGIGNDLLVTTEGLVVDRFPNAQPPRTTVFDESVTDPTYGYPAEMWVTDTHVWVLTYRAVYAAEITC